MKVCAPAAKRGKTSGLSNTRTRSRYEASSSPPRSPSSWARKASASSVESAAIRIGASEGLDRRDSMVRLVASMAELNRAPVNGGAETLAQSAQHLSSERTCCAGMCASFANQACAGSDCSNHCSRSLASYARTSFQRPFAFLDSTQAAFPAQRRGVTNTNVVCARSLLSSAFTLFSKSPSAFALGSSLVPNSQPERPAGTQGVPPPASTNPSQPERSASSLPGKSTVVSPLPVEC